MMWFCFNLLGTNLLIAFAASLGPVVSFCQVHIQQLREFVWCDDYRRIMTNSKAVWTIATSIRGLPYQRRDAERVTSFFFLMELTLHPIRDMENSLQWSLLFFPCQMSIRTKKVCLRQQLRSPLVKDMREMETIKWCWGRIAGSTPLYLASQGHSRHYESI